MFPKSPAGAPTLSVPLDNIEGIYILNGEKGNLDEWETCKKGNLPQRKIQSGIEKDNAHFTACEYIRKYSAKKRIFRNNDDVWLKTA